MLSAPDFDSLQIGDLIETKPFFPALSDEPVVLRTAERKGDRLDFVVTYFGVTLGRWSCTKNDGGLRWATK